MRLSKAERDAIVAHMASLTRQQRDDKRKELHLVALRAWKDMGIAYDGSNFFREAWDKFLVAFVGMQSNEDTACTWITFKKELRRGVEYCRARIDAGAETKYNRLGNVIHDPGIVSDFAGVRRKELRARLKKQEAARKIAASHPLANKTAEEHFEQMLPIARKSFASIREAARHTTTSEQEQFVRRMEKAQFIQPTEQEIIAARRRTNGMLNSLISNVSQQLNPNTQND
jgi:hypothetical protein